MRKIVLFGMAAMLMAGAAAAQELDGRVSVTWNPTETSLQVASLTGRPEFTHEGDYYQLIGEVRKGKFVAYLAYQFGESDHVEGGDDPTSPTFNPMTDEELEMFDLTVGYQLLDTPYTGRMDLAVGYYRLWADPAISPSNWYAGPEVTLKGNKRWENGFGVDYRVAYVPSFSVNGYIAVALEDRYIFHYRVAAEYFLGKSFGFQAGYQEYKIKAKVKFDGTDALVNPAGFFAGVVYNF